MNNIHIDLVHWENVKGQVTDLNPDLATLIESVPGIHSTKFILAKFPFGTSLLHHKVSFWDLDKNPLFRENPSVKKELSKLLDYTWQITPPGILLENTMELYINMQSHTIPLRVIKPGELLALHTFFEHDAVCNIIENAYSLMAGSRSLFLLPKISHKLYNQRLRKRYGISENLLPKSFFEHFDLLNEICQSERFKSQWGVTVLLFTKDFVDHLSKVPPLKDELVQHYMRNNVFARNQELYDLVWSVFVQTLPLAVRNTPFIVQTAKHLIKLVLRIVPGYVPATNNLGGPISELTKVFLTVYNIRYYLPIFMTPALYDGVNPVYYSLHKHTYFYPMDKKSNVSRTINELNIIQEVMSQFKDFIYQDKTPFPLKGSSLYRRLKLVDFEFFHPHATGNISQDIDALVEQDPRFMSLINKFNVKKDLRFPDRSIFFNGCIKLKPIKPAQVKVAMREFLMPLFKKTKVV